MHLHLVECLAATIVQFENKAIASHTAAWGYCGRLPFGSCQILAGSKHAKLAQLALIATP